MKRSISLFGLLVLTTLNVFSQEADSLRLDIIEDEYWWGGISSLGKK